MQIAKIVIRRRRFELYLNFTHTLLESQLGQQPALVLAAATGRKTLFKFILLLVILVIKCHQNHRK